MNGLFRKSFIAVAGVTLLFFSGCESPAQVMDGDGMFQTFQYTEISQEEAKRMMEQDDGHVIVDVRRQDEYDSGHIPGAVLIPNESIEKEPPKELPEFDQIILVYCRSGRRSKEAAQKLADMGYKNVYEFGGIQDWTGDVVTGKETEETTERDSEMKDKTATLRFDSFDGGGPEFDLHIEDESIVSYTELREYAREDHDEVTGAGYEVVFTFTGKKPGETEMLIEERSPIAENLDMKYKIVVSDDLSVKIEEVSATDLNER